MTAAAAHTADAAGERALISDALGKIFDAHPGGDATADLEGFGIREMIDDDPALTIPLLFERQGAAGATSNAFNEVLLFLLREQFGDGLGQEPVTVVVSASAPDGISATPVADDRWHVRGLAVCETSRDAPIVAVGNTEGRTCLLAFDAQPGLSVESTGGIDPGLQSVLVQADSANPRVVIDSEQAAAAWQRTLDWARIALAGEILGAVSKELTLASAYAKERKQFGRPIGSFQAIKHKLAEVRVALDGASAAVDAAAAHPDSLSAMVAKSMSGRAGRLAATNCLQTFGGIGFTWEHDFHRYMKRVMVLDQLLGSAAQLPALIGAQVLHVGTAPRVGEL